LFSSLSVSPSGESMVRAVPTRSARPKIVFTARSFWSTV
jgi:hypothetical protein